MSQIFAEDGSVVPVTLIKAETSISTDLENKDIAITGTSKGKGFTGGMKRWNFKGQMATRGQSNTPRSNGSPGAQTPGRVLKGKKMSGRHGNKTVTIKGIKIVKIDVSSNGIFVTGPVPGARNSNVLVKIL